MALERSQREQQQQQEAEQKHQQQELQQRQQREEAGGGLGGGSPSPRSSDISSSGRSRGAGAGAGAGAPKHPIHPLLAITAPPGHVGSAVVDTTVDIDHRCRAPHGWQRCLNLKTGKIFYKDPFDCEEGDDMSRNGKNPRLDLSLNLSAHRGSSSGVAGGSSSGNRNNTNNRNNNNNNNSSNNNNNRGNRNSPRHRSSSSSSPSSPASPLSSCVSSEAEQEAEPTSMVLVGCPHCLMYVMLSEEDPRCPKCKSTVLLDFLNDPKNPGASSTRKAKKKN